MSRPRRLYFKRTHAAARIFAGVCFLLAAFMAFPVYFSVSDRLKDKDFSLPALLAREDLAPLMVLWGSPVALVLFGLGVMAVHRGVFLEPESRTVTVYWGWSLPFGKAWPWWRVETRSLRVGAPLEIRAPNPEATWSTSLMLSLADGSLVLFSELDHSDTRNKAESMARLLELELRDFAERTHDAQVAAVEEPPPRATPWTASLREGEARVVYLPAQRPPKHPTQLIVKVLSSLGCMAVVYALFTWSQGNEPNVWLLGLLMLGSLVWPLFEEYSNTKSHVLRGSRGELVVESESLLGRKVQRFPRADVRQVEVVHGIEQTDEDKKKRKVSRLRVRGSHFELVLGAHLPGTELQARAQELRAALGLESAG